jgi:hypothetical protein
MATEIVRSQVRTVSAGTYQTVDTVTLVADLPDVNLYLYATATSSFSSVCTVSDIATYPVSRNAALAAGLNYYRQPSVTLTHSTATKANTALQTLNARLTALAVEADASALDFAGSSTITVTADGVEA